MTGEQAIDVMMAHVLAAVPADCVALWPGVPSEIPDTGDWVRPAVRHADGGQSSLAGEDGARRFTRRGLLVIQCFAPVGDGNKGINQLTDNFVMKLEAIRGSPVWYRNIHAVDVGKEGSSTQANVIAEFEYDHYH